MKKKVYIAILSTLAALALIFAGRFVMKENETADAATSTTLKSGSSVNTVLKNLCNDSTVKAIVYTDTPWEGIESSTNIAATGEIPVYVRVAPNDGLVDFGPSVRHTSSAGVDFNGNLVHGTYMESEYQYKICIPGAESLDVSLKYLLHGLLEITDTNNAPLLTSNAGTKYTFSTQKYSSSYNATAPTTESINIPGDTVVFTYREISGISEGASFAGYNALISAVNRTTPDCNVIYIYSEADTICLPQYASNMFKDLKNVVYIDTTWFDTSRTLSLADFFAGCQMLSQIDLSGWNTQNVKNYTRMFYNCRNLEEIDLSHLNTSNAESMNSMFDHCFSLHTITLGAEFDSSNVTDFGYMFECCFALQADAMIPYLNTSKATSLRAMFKSCTLVTHLNLTTWDVSQVSDFSDMFYGCSPLVSVDCRGWNTESATTLANMFTKCFSLKEILGIEQFNTSNVTNLTMTFGSCRSLTELDLHTWDTAKVTKMTATFAHCKKLQSLSVSTWDTSSVTDMAALFDHLETLPILDISQWDVSKVTDMAGMFHHMNKVQVLDVSAWDTSSLIYMTSGTGYPRSIYTYSDYRKDPKYFTSSSDEIYIFQSTASGMFGFVPLITTLNLSNWDTSHVTSLASVFSYCRDLREIIGIEDIDTSMVTSLEGTFQECASLKNLDLRNWDVSKNTSLASTFYMGSYYSGNGSYRSNSEADLECLDISGWDTSQVLSLYHAFAHISLDAVVGMEALDTSKVKNMSEVFEYSSSSKSSLDLSQWDTSSALSMVDLFNPNPSNDPTYTLNVLDISSFDLTKIDQSSEYNSALFVTSYATQTLTIKKIIGPKTIPASLNVTLPGTYYIDDNEDLIADSRIAYTSFKSGTNNESHIYVRSDTPGLTFLDAYPTTLQEGDNVNSLFKAIIDATTNSIVYTTMPQGSGDHLNIALPDATPVNIRKVVDNYETDTSTAKYAHTPNVNDAGVQNGNYSSNFTDNQIVTVPGATSLHITLTYGTESLSYDWVSVIEGEYTGSAANSKTAIGVIGTYGGNKNTPTTVELDVPGDTVTFSFRSDSSQEFYGYYAIVYGITATESHIEVYSDADLIYANPDSESLFASLTTIKMLDASWLNFAKVTSIANIFANDSNIEEIRLSVNNSSLGIVLPDTDLFIDDDQNRHADTATNYRNTAIAPGTPAHIYRYLVPIISMLKPGIDVNTALLGVANSNARELIFTHSAWENIASSPNIALETYEPIYVRRATKETTRYAHTANIDDEGTKNGNYAANTNDVQTITIPGATSLQVSLSYGTQSTSWGSYTDWVAVYTGTYTGGAANSSSSNSTYAANRQGIYYGNTNSPKTTTIAISGDTVSFAFHSNGSSQYYGYYAVVTYTETVLEVCSDADTIYANPDSTEMFKGLANLTSIDTSWFDTSIVTDVSSIFESNASLVDIPGIEGWDTSGVTNASGMFSGCSSLQYLDLSGFDLNAVTNATDMLKNCSSLTSIWSPNEIKEGTTISLPAQFYVHSVLTMDASHFDTYYPVDPGIRAEEVSKQRAVLSALWAHPATGSDTDALFQSYLAETESYLDTVTGKVTEMPEKRYLDKAEADYTYRVGEEIYEYLKRNNLDKDYLHYTDAVWQHYSDTVENYIREISGNTIYGSDLEYEYIVDYKTSLPATATAEQVKAELQAAYSAIVAAKPSSASHQNYSFTVDAPDSVILLYDISTNSWNAEVEVNVSDVSLVDDKDSVKVFIPIGPGKNQRAFLLTADRDVSSSLSALFAGNRPNWMVSYGSDYGEYVTISRNAEDTTINCIATTGPGYISLDSSNGAQIAMAFDVVYYIATTRNYNFRYRTRMLN